MKKGIMFVVLAMVICFTFINNGFAKGIGVVKPETIDKDFYIPIEEWKGEKFIFAERSKSVRKYGYQLTAIGSKSISSSLPYNEWVGKIVIVESVSDDKTIKFNYNGTKIFMWVAGGSCAKDIISFRDLENAKKRWKDKIVYSKSKIICTYDEDGEKGKEFGSIKVSVVDPLKVIEVIPSMNGLSNNHGGGIWLVVENSKKEIGYIDVAYSWTNQYQGDFESKYSNGKRPWINKISESDPSKEFKWSNETIKDIDEGKIHLKMDKNAVEWSWGKPKNINRGVYESGSTEQWVYGSGACVYFDNSNLVTAIQN